MTALRRNSREKFHWSRCGGSRTAPLGVSKAGLSADLDDLAAYVHSLTSLPVSPSPALADGEALFVQGDAHWFQIDPDLTVTQLATSCPRASGGHTALLPSGALGR